MSQSKNSSQNISFGLEQLASLPTVPAEEFSNWGPLAVQATECPKEKISPFASAREYRFCRAVRQNPMRPSSTYSKLAGVSSKAAVSIRRKLVSCGYVREHVVDSGCRGRSAIVLEISPAGEKAVTSYESVRNGHEC